MYIIRDNLKSTFFEVKDHNIDRNGVHSLVCRQKKIENEVIYDAWLEITAAILNQYKKKHLNDDMHCLIIYLAHIKLIKIH